MLILACLALAISTVQASDMLGKQINSYHKELSEEFRHSAALNKKHMAELLGATEFVCTGGKNPDDLGHKEYLEEFAAGPCAPAIFIPGIAGSKLKAVIDCPILRRSDPMLFASCGWKSCDGRSGPAEEYTIWIPDPLSPMSMIKPFKNSRECFAGIIGLNSQFDEDGKIVFVEKEGVKVAPFGETPDTQHNSSCGFSSITYLVEFDYGLDIQVMGYFENLRSAFHNAGYRAGLTMQALPYDWRKGYRENNLDFKFERAVDRLHEISGKKVIIAAHSMGNFQTVHNLWKMDQAKKDEKIARYFAMAPPFLGAPEASIGPFGMDSSFAQRLVYLELGITAKMYKDSIAGFPSTFQLQISRFFRVHKDSEFMRVILERVAHEEKNEPTPESNFLNDFFPNAKEICSPDFVERDDATCKTGIHEIWKIGTLQGLPITPDTLSDLYEIYSYDPKAYKIWKWAQDERFDHMINPGVQTNILYSNHILSRNKLTFNADPRTRTTFNEFFVPDLEFTQGDATVVTTSAIVPGIKWAYEFSKKSTFPGAKPATLVEICGIKNQKTSVFDDETNRKVTKNQYMGVKCNCRGGGGKKVEGKACDHQNLVADLGVVSFVLESSIDNQTGSVGQRFKDMTDDQIKYYQEDCKIFYEPKNQ